VAHTSSVRDEIYMQTETTPGWNERRQVGMGLFGRHRNRNYADSFENAFDVRVNGKHVPAQRKKQNAPGRLGAYTVERKQRFLSIEGIEPTERVEVKRAVLGNPAQYALNPAALGLGKATGPERVFEGTGRRKHNVAPCWKRFAHRSVGPGAVCVVRVLREDRGYQGIKRIAHLPRRAAVFVFEALVDRSQFFLQPIAHLYNPCFQTPP